MMSIRGLVAIGLGQRLGGVEARRSRTHYREMPHADSPAVRERSLVALVLEQQVAALGFSIASIGPANKDSMPGSWIRQWTLVSSTSISASTAWPMAWTLSVSRSPAHRSIDMACPARNMIPELVDIAGDPAASLVAAKLVRQVDVDWSLHGWKDEAVAVAFQSPAGFDGQ